MCSRILALFREIDVASDIYSVFTLAVRLMGNTVTRVNMFLTIWRSCIAVWKGSVLYRQIGYLGTVCMLICSYRSLLLALLALFCAYSFSHSLPSSRARGVRLKTMNQLPRFPTVSTQSALCPCHLRCAARLNWWRSNLPHFCSLCWATVLIHLYISLLGSSLALSSISNFFLLRSLLAF